MRYNVCTPRPKKDSGTFWLKIGMAFEGKKGINVYLDALPIPDAEGKCQISLFEQKDKQDFPSSDQPKQGDSFEDEVPW